MCVARDAGAGRERGERAVSDWLWAAGMLGMLAVIALHEARKERD